MDMQALVKCYVIGVMAASGIGPIFVLTFNRAAIHGFVRGFATAMGAAIADALFFCLALFGVLAMLEESSKFMVALDFIGGVSLFFLAYRMIRKARAMLTINIGYKENVVVTFLRSFLLTMFNPMTLFFFMLIVVKVLPEEAELFLLGDVLVGSLLVSIGSLTILGTVSLVASQVGHRISVDALKTISYLTSTTFVVFGCYLFGRFVLALHLGW